MILLITALLAGTAHAASADKFVSVTGQCSRQSSPDRGSVTLTAETSEKTAAEASEKVTKLYEKVRAEVKKLKLADAQLQTTNYNVYADYDYNSGKQKLRGFKAQMGLHIETSEIAKLGDVMAIATKNGVQNVSGLSTYLSITKSREEHEACLEDAVKNARLKADRMAKAGGAKVGEVLALEEYQRARAEHPAIGGAAKSTSFALAEGESSPPPPTMETRQQDVAVTVYVTFSLK